MFPRPGGRVRLSVTKDNLTPFGGLVPWAAFTRHIGILDRLAADCPAEQSSPKAALVYDVLQSSIPKALTDGRRFLHIERLREDPTIPEIFRMELVAGNDTMRRFFQSVNLVLGVEWIAPHAEPMWRALPEPIVLDRNATVQPKYGHQEGAQVGYNPGKPGRRSFHPLLTVVAQTLLCPACRIRKSDTVSTTDWRETLEDAQRCLGERKVLLSRGGLGLGHDAVMSWQVPRSVRSRRKRGGAVPRFRPARWRRA